ncbi:MAG TPA: hypothetical protein VHW23_07045 [Kofleriaceae bacterium]|jgi:hypothetical protein|nr:hypothetical protein [Kofleriaceae bacterium]
MGRVETDPRDAERTSTVAVDQPAGPPDLPVIARAPLSTPPAGMAVAHDGDAHDGHSERAVKWLLAAGLLRKLLAIARSFVANELDMRDWMCPAPAADFATGRDEVWFDYIADTGDDARVMRALAGGFERPFAAGTLGAAHPALPVGEFLFVGGDTAYYISDEATLRRRFVAPLNAAHTACGDPRTPRPIFAIPGNHDYYDHLTGFNRLFRKPYPEGAASVLGLTGFHSTQEASYLKIRLPHDWQLWGVDLQTHGVDYRQRMYFRAGGLPERLILCTPTPPVSLDRVQVARDPQDNERKAYLQLLDPGREPCPATPAPDFDPAFTPDSGGQQPPAGSCRLYLSGDDHHYARYNGQPASGPGTATSVATIVSGGGGAFTHPTEHTCGTLAAAVKYPPREVSRDKIASALVNPLAIIRAGTLHVLGAGLVLLFCWAWPDPPRSLIDPAIWTGCVAASLGLCVGSVVLARQLARRRTHHAKRERGHGGPLAPPGVDRLWELSVFIAPVGTIAALALPIVLHLWRPEVDPLSTASLWLISATMFVIGLVLFASLRGTQNLDGVPAKIGFGLLGLAHAAMLLALPYLMVLRGWRVAALAIAAVMIVFAPLAKRLYRRAPAWSITALWLLQGLGAIAALWWGPWGSLAWGWSAGLLAAAVGAIVVPMQFGFYLLTCSAWNGHNNEAGITARLTLCKQWIRFHVTRDAVTGYVIGFDDPLAPHPVPRLVDQFVIAPAPGARLS